MIMERPRVTPQCDICDFRFITSAGKTDGLGMDVEVWNRAAPTLPREHIFLPSKMCLLGHSVYRLGSRWFILRLEKMLAPGGSSLRDCVSPSGV